MSLYNKYYEKFEKEYLMYAMIGVLVSSALGAAAAMLALYDGHGFIQMFQVGLLVAVCMGFNATILANRGAKTVYNWLLISCMASILILTIHLIV